MINFMLGFGFGVVLVLFLGYIMYLYIYCFYCTNNMIKPLRQTKHSGDCDEKIF